SSSPMRDEQMAVVDKILTDLGAAGKPQLTIFNKIDKYNRDELGMLPTKGLDALEISAFSADDLLRLREAIQENMTGDTRTFVLPAERGDLIALAYRTGEVTKQEVDGDLLRLTVELNKQDYEVHGYKLEAYSEQ
ncbi:GTPase HflX, partial [Paenibacillus sepulcri]|nr:GTPase HflX [Paenibacillus sepulcri]